MRLYSNGSLGINNSSSPQALLHLGATDVQNTLFAGAYPGVNQSGAYLTLNTPVAGGGNYGTFTFSSISKDDGDGFGTSTFYCDAEEGFTANTYASGSGVSQATLNITKDAAKLSVNNGADIDITAYNNSDINIGTYTSTGGTINLLTRSTSSLFIDTSQRVGIGTGSPIAKLEVNGTFNVNSIGDRVIIADPSAGTFSIGDLDALQGEAQIVGDGTVIQINNNGNTTLTATNSNRIGIGITGPSYPLHVSGNVSNISIYSTHDIVAFSDQSVKTNIRPIENALERVVQSRGVLYDRTDSGEKDNIGFIAQELEIEFPELVVTNEDGTKAVKYQNTVAVLFEAIKELKAEIDILKQK